MMRKAGLAAFVLGALTIGTVTSALGMRASAELQAFLRPRTRADALPRRPFRIVAGTYRVVDSRRIAGSSDRRGRTALLYLVKVVGHRNRPGICLQLITASASGGACFALSVAQTFAYAGRVIAVEGRLFGGVASNNVARVVLVTVRGKRQNADLSRDKGFIYDCQNTSGCAATRAVRAVEAYGRKGALLSRTAYPGGRR